MDSESVDWKKIDSKSRFRNPRRYGLLPYGLVEKLRMDVEKWKRFGKTRA